MDYQESLRVLDEALKFGIDPSLEPIRAMCAALGNPQDAYACVQVAGTNGKSSVTRMTAALLRACGKRVGLYTSPELVEYPERIEINGAPVSHERFADGIEAAQAAAAKAGVEATEFELLTAAALWLFAEEGVDYAVLECGLGGRWDATSVCNPRVAVITGIGLDHTAILGDTTEAIAAEKAAIIKPGCKVVLPPSLVAREVFEQQALNVGAPVVEVDEGLAPQLVPYLTHMPSYQASNATVAYTAAGLVEPVTLQTAKAAFESLQIPGRFETLRTDPLLMIDAAHNPQSAQVLAEEVRRRFDASSMPTLLLGVLADKDVRGIVHELAPLFPEIVITASNSPRAISPEELMGVVVEEVTGSAQGHTLRLTHSIPEALDLLKNEPVLATGSITVAGEVKACALGL